jgi:hypothetical protein
LKRDVLAAFSSLDHGVTAAMTSPEIEDAFVRLLLRLAVLCLLHGESVPRRFLADLRECNPDAAVNLIGGYIEYGEPTIADRTTSELQQEIVHFSRIVDVDSCGLQSSDNRTLRRLHKSTHMPESLKVLTELLIVARGRLAQRGISVAVPTPPSGGPLRRELRDSTVLQTDGDPTNYVVRLSSSRRRAAIQAGYYMHALLTYVTPAEACAAVCAWLAESTRDESVSMASAWMASEGQLGTLRWTIQPDRVYVDPFHAAESLLPDVTTIQVPTGASVDVTVDAGRGAVLTLSVRDDAQSSVSYPVNGDTRPLMATLEGRTNRWDGDLQNLGHEAAKLLADRGCGTVRSIECGHVHLDRALDIDQEAGVSIGTAVYQYLIGKQGSPPLLVPMVDDDHVLVRLRPADYVAFLRARLQGDARFRLVMESSPIVRSIAVVLYQRLKHLQPDKLRSRGGNVYVQLRDETYCELFEGWGGTPANGCVLFETALLVYRTDPAVFDRYVEGRLGLTGSIHDQAATLLDQDRPHDELVAEIQLLYEGFRALTDPGRSDSEFSGVVQGVLSAATPIVVHLNVLEDYYEIQQSKVRQLLALMELPLRLLTIHFSAQTGRVTLDG